MKIKSILSTFALLSLFLLGLSPQQTFANSFDKTTINISSDNIEIYNNELKTSSFESFEDNLIFKDPKGVVFFNLEHLGNLIQENISYEIDKEKNVGIFTYEYPIMKLASEESYSATYLEVDFNSGKIKIKGNKHTLLNNPVLKNGKVYLPLRETLNQLGYHNDLISYSPLNETVSINKMMYFGIDKITVTDRLNYGYFDENVHSSNFQVVNLKSINEIIKLLTEETFYKSDRQYRLLVDSPTFKLDFNNGIALNFYDADLQLCKIMYSNPKDSKSSSYLQVPYSVAVAIENFIYENSNYDLGAEQSSEKHIQYVYKNPDGSVKADKEYIIVDYINVDYSNLTEYIATRIDESEKNFLLMEIKEDENRIFISFKSDYRAFTIPGGKGSPIYTKDIDRILGV